MQPSDVLELTGDATPVRTLVRDLWRRRDLLPLLAAKDFHARYRSASLGVLWSVLLPLLQGGVLAVVFTKVVKIQTDYSYPVFVIAGMVTWSYFSSSLMAGSTSIVDGGAIAGKVYFPRLLLPAVPATANLPTFGASSGVVLLLMAGFGVPYRASLLLLPVAIALVLALAVVLSALVSLAHVYSRDVRYIVQATLLVALYATPVIYPLERAGGLRPLIIANPMTGAVQLVRFAIFGEADLVGVAIVVTLTWLVALVVATLLAYRRHERIAVDRL
jgi:ABC-type polysaccharide/polyol phosphate export permease